MGRSQVVLGALVILVVGLYATLAGVGSAQGSQWYQALPKPSFQPPDLVFGLIWPYNFLALAVAGLVLVARAPLGLAATWVGVLVISAAAALGWVYLFYGPHALWPAAAVLAVSAVAAWGLVALAARAVPWTALVLAPYAIWVSVATALAVAYARTPTG